MTNSVLALAIGVVFVAVLLSTNLGYWAMRSRREQESKELSRRIGTMADQGEVDIFELQVRDQLVDALGGYGKRLDDLLKQAGAMYTVTGLVQRMVGAAIVGLVLAFVVFRGPGAVVGLLGGFVPFFWLNMRANKRGRKLSEQLPDALDLIARSLQAGHGLSDALRLCAEEMPMPVAGEFGRAYEQNNLGKDLRDCLGELCQRNPQSFDMKIFVSSVLLQRDTGGNLIEIIENISNTIRDRFVFENKVKALTSEAKFSAGILAGLPFAVSGMISVVNPDYLKPLFSDPMGNLILGFAGMLFMTGLFLMKAMSTVDV